MTRPGAELLQGTLDMLILKTLEDEALHGWAVAKRIRARSGEVLQIPQGSLYPALYRLVDRGWIRGRWGTSPEGRRAKLYALTAAGRKRLQAESEGWRLLSLAVNEVMQTS